VDYEEHLEQCDRILELCAQIDGDGRDFSESVSEKVESMASWIEANERVTEKMGDALDRMEAGAQKWIRD